MAGEQTGLVPFSEPGQGDVPIVVVDSLVPYTLPLEFFPEWKNDAGVQAFGGARYVSIFEDGAVEGADTPNVQAVTQTLIAGVGGIMLPNPDPAQTYRVRIRMRSAVGDVNYTDRVVVFRVVTPLMVPVVVGQYEADQEPGISYNELSGEFTFQATVGSFPSGEIRLHDGRGGVVLPNAAATPFSQEAQLTLQALAGRLRKFPFTVDFAPDGAGVESWMRLTYWAVVDSGTNQITITRFRRRDHAAWGWFQGNDIDFIDATIDREAQTASVTFLRGHYALGPRFDNITIIGNGGSFPIDPKAAIAGVEIDVTPAVDFSRTSHLSASRLQDKFLLLVCQTVDKTLIREIPLRPQGQFDVVGEDGVTNFFDAFSGATFPGGQQPLFFRILFEDYLEVPNFTQYYDPNTALVPIASTLPYPRVENIRIYEEANGATSVVYTDLVDLFENMFTIRCSEVGVSRHVLDLRTLRRDVTPFTPIPKTAAYIRVEMDIDVDGDPANVYTIDARYTLNSDGQPQVWLLPGTVTNPDRPSFTFDPITFEVVMTIPAGSAIVSGTMDIGGDLASFNLAALLAAVGAPAISNPGDTTIPQAALEQVTTRYGDLIEVGFTNDNGTFRTRFALEKNPDLITGTLGNAIKAHFTGHTIVFTDLDGATSLPNKEVMIVGNGPPIIIYDAVVNQPYFLNFQGASTLDSSMHQTHVDLVYDSSGERTQVRIYNSFFDSRSGEPRSLSIIPGATWGLSGFDQTFLSFSAPGMRFNLSSAEVEFEPDARIYDFVYWTFWNLANTRQQKFFQRPETGRSYQLGAVLEGVEPGQQLLFAARHRGGVERTFVVTVPPEAGGEFSIPKPVALNPAQ